MGDYIFPEDNEPEGIESIVMDYPERNGVQVNALIEIYASDIIDIKEL